MPYTSFKYLYVFIILIFYLRSIFKTKNFFSIIQNERNMKAMSYSKNKTYKYT